MKNKEITIKLPEGLWEGYKKVRQPTYHIKQDKQTNGVYWLDYRDFGGQRIRKSLGTKSKREANARRKQWIKMIEDQL